MVYYANWEIAQKKEKAKVRLLINKYPHWFEDNVWVDYRFSIGIDLVLSGRELAWKVDKEYWRLKREYFARKRAEARERQVEWRRYQAALAAERVNLYTTRSLLDPPRKKRRR